jgi:hypothetical protein
MSVAQTRAARRRLIQAYKPKGKAALDTLKNKDLKGKRAK